MCSKSKQIASEIIKGMIRMKIKSLKVKIIILMFICLIVMSIVGNSIIKINVSNIIIERIEEEATMILENTRISLVSLLESENYSDAEKLIASMSENEIINTLSFYNLKQQVQYSSDLSTLGDYADSICVEEVVQSRSDIAANLNVKEEIYEMAIPLDETTLGGVLYLKLNAGFINDVIKNSTIQLIVMFDLLCLMFMHIIIVVINILVIKPLKIFKASSEKIIQKDYSTNIDINRNDEFGDLAKLHNEMIKSIKDYTDSLKNHCELAEKDSEEKMNFLALMSHEIRTPLNSITGFASLLLETVESEEDLKELEIIMESSNHLIRVINEILDIAKFEQQQLVLDKKPFSLRKIINEVDDMFQLQVESKGIEYYAEVTSDVPDFVSGDEYRVKEIIINLMSNAVKFTYKGSIRLTVNFKDGIVLIRIKDTGIGISKEKEKTLFDAFAQSDESATRLYGGTGLGLAISKRIAVRMGGDIRMISEGTTGSEFIVSIKADKIIDNEYLEEHTGESMVERWVTEDSTTREIVLELLPTLHGRIGDIENSYNENNKSELELKIHALKGVTSHLNINEIYNCLKDFEMYVHSVTNIQENGYIYVKNLNDIISHIPKRYLTTERIIEETTNGKSAVYLKILLAEDVLENRLLIKKILEKSEVNIDFAANGIEAVALLTKNFYDCILLDIQMPILSGLDVLVWLSKGKEESTDYVIALTENTGKEDMKQYLEMGCDWCLSKPIDKDLLRNKINELKYIKSNKGKG